MQLYDSTLLMHPQQCITSQDFDKMEELYHFMLETNCYAWIGLNYKQLGSLILSNDEQM